MKTQKLYTLLALLLMAGSVTAQNNCWDGSVAEAYAGGDGTPENPYQIATAEQLARLAQQTNNGEGGYQSYVLTDDICLNANVNYPDYSWTPIGSLSDNGVFYFSGRFDGNGKTISGLYYENNGTVTDSVTGLFGCTWGAEILNLNLSQCRLEGVKSVGALVAWAGQTDISGCCVSEATVTCETGCAGGLIGYWGMPYGMGGDDGTAFHVTDCHALQGVSITGNHAGGVVGQVNRFYSQVPCALSNCTGNAVVCGSQNIGGIIGVFYNGTIDACQCWNELNTAEAAGGIVGFALRADISRCQNGVHVGKGSYSGGIVGVLRGGNITDCENYGWIECAGFGTVGDAGGIAGCVAPYLTNDDKDYVIRNCHNYGEVSGAGDDAGGIVGYVSGAKKGSFTIVDCSNTGWVHESVVSSGIVGFDHEYPLNILNVFNTGQIGARMEAAGIIGEVYLTWDKYNVFNAYNAGQLVHEIENYPCPRGSIMVYANWNYVFSSCYWIDDDEYGCIYQGPELENSSAFNATPSVTVWALDNTVFGTQDLLTALNAGAELIESQFPDVGEVSRWREDTDMENGGFPVFGHYDAIGESPSILSVTVYPNPAKEKVTIDGIEASEIQVYNALGQLVKTMRDANEISVANLPQGVYLLRIADAERKVYTNKITIQ